MKYAVEVAKTGSVNKASKALLIAQPNLSRCIKELEAELGICIFERSARGMMLTKDGEVFISHARRLIAHMDDIAKIYKGGRPSVNRFSISAPEADYISFAFSDFVRANSSNGESEFRYYEDTALNTVERVGAFDCRLGIIRYCSDYDKVFRSMLKDKIFNCELISEFSFLITMRKDSPLASMKSIRLQDLKPYIRISECDTSDLPSAKLKRDNISGESSRRLFVSDRALRFRIVSENPEAFMWHPKTSEDNLEKYGLVQKKFSGPAKVFKDVLIYKKGYLLSDLDKDFITRLCDSKRKYLD